MTELYPLKFCPILKEKIWGGDSLHRNYNKQYISSQLGESWELSGIKGNESVVANGFLQGTSFNDLIQKFGEELIGKHYSGNSEFSFPLLFKLIDANDNLSIQVHPNDETASIRHDSLGKTEMWYVLHAEPEAEIIVGFNEESSKASYLQALHDAEIEQMLQKVKVHQGDVFFIPAGLVHAIGKGVVVAEIQQSSDVTYRIYDYNRKDDNGKQRDLHTNLALDVIDFSVAQNSKIAYNSIVNEVTPLVQCDYFTTNLFRFDSAQFRNYSTLDTFVVYMCVEGSLVLECENEKTIINKGETVFIPAAIKQVKLIPATEVTLLEVYI